MNYQKVLEDFLKSTSCIEFNNLYERVSFAIKAERLRFRRCEFNKYLWDLYLLSPNSPGAILILPQVSYVVRVDKARCVLENQWGTKVLLTSDE